MSNQKGLLKERTKGETIRAAKGKKIFVHVKIVTYCLIKKGMVIQIEIFGSQNFPNMLEKLLLKIIKLS